MADGDPEPEVRREHTRVQVQRRPGLQPALHPRGLRGGLPGQDPQPHPQTDAEERGGAVRVPRERARRARRSRSISSGPKEEQDPADLWICSRILADPPGSRVRGQLLHRGVSRPPGRQPLPLGAVQLGGDIGRVRRGSRQRLYHRLQPQPDGAVQDVSGVWTAHRGEGGVPLRSADESEVELSWWTLRHVEVLASAERCAALRGSDSADSYRGCVIGTGTRTQCGTDDQACVQHWGGAADQPAA